MLNAETVQESHIICYWLLNGILGILWMDERCFRPLFCTVKAELGLGQPGLMR